MQGLVYVIRSDEDESNANNLNNENAFSTFDLNRTFIMYHLCVNVIQNAFIHVLLD